MNPAFRHDTHRRLALAWLLAMAGAPAAPGAEIKTADNSVDNERWRKVRASLFGERPITEDDSVVVLEAPARAEDAAVVPIALRAQFEQKPERHVRKMTLVIDNNPSPLAAVFTYTLDSGRADIETRVRIDEYTYVRAIAETGDGQLHMSKRFVKASGGCSAPPGKDPQAAKATLGQMRLSVKPEALPGRPVLAQLMISHPNDSGLVMDQATRLYTPAWFVRQIDVRHNGKLVLQADVDFAISENPHLRFYFTPGGSASGGELTAEVVDSKDLRFEQRTTLRPGAAR
jgi:sulfur-oxidizing protein SoxY